MADVELDHAKPCDLKVIDTFYESNLESIVKLDSPTPSQRTVSSTSSIVRHINLKANRSGTSSDSDSDEDGLELDSVPTRDNFLQYQTSSPANNNVLLNNGDNVIMVNHADNNNVAHTNGPRINSVAIQHSSDIQFGDKTFYNGPVTIKQFLLDDRKKKWVCKSNDEIAQIENGILNKVFDGSQVAVNVNGLQTQNETKTESSSNNNLFKIRNYTISRKNALLTFLTATCAFIAIVSLLIYVFSGQQSLQQQPSLGDGDDSRRNIAINSTIGSDLLLGRVLRLHPRDDWLAQPPNNELTKLILPAKRVIITHTATQSCEFTAECTLRVRLIQTYHMESKNWDDIGYNFLVGGDGEVYEGRGWDKQGAHTKGYNTGSIGIAYIGTFNKIEPNKKQLLAGELLMEEGVKLGKLIPDFKIYAHRQLIASESPGAAFYELIKKWDHWTNDPPEVFQ